MDGLTQIIVSLVEIFNDMAQSPLQPVQDVFAEIPVGILRALREMRSPTLASLDLSFNPITEGPSGVYRTEALQLLEQLLSTPGNALTSQPDTPFHSLRHYGTHYLDKLEAAAVPAPILRRITLVDSPGVQAGEKQKGGRGYDFQEVIKWWAQHSDRI